MEALEKLVLEAETLTDRLTAVWTAALLAENVPAMQRAKRVRDAAWARRNRRQMAWARQCSPLRVQP